MTATVSSIFTTPDKAKNLLTLHDPPIIPSRVARWYNFHTPESVTLMSKKICAVTHFQNSFFESVVRHRLNYPKMPIQLSRYDVLIEHLLSLLPPDDRDDHQPWK